jgi:hypothetical protein
MTMTPELAPVPTVGQRFAGLVLQAAAPQGGDEWDAAVFHRLLDQLSPGAATVLSLFLDDRPRPAIQILSRTRFGEVEFAVSAVIGRACGGHHASAATAYLTHLMALGLLEVGPALQAEPDYDTMESEIALRSAQREARELTGNATLRRCSVRLTRLGRAFLDEVTDS